MPSQTIGVDLGKSWFQIAVADDAYRIQQRRRLNRFEFQAWLVAQESALFVMEACGSSQHWARLLRAHGHSVKLLPAQYVKAYVRRSKHDAADAAALVEASRCEDIRSVAVKTIDQQVLLQLHRLRTQWQAGRTARICALRGMLREFGVDIAEGASRGIREIRTVFEMKNNDVPDHLRPFISELLQEIGCFELQVEKTEAAMRSLTEQDPVVQRLREIPGIGLIIATSLRASVADIQRFGSARRFSSWLGVTARENSSGAKRRLGLISKMGDPYLRMLLIQGARSLLLAAGRNASAGRELDLLARWAVQTQARIGRNKAAIAVANKLGRIIWATWKFGRAYDGNWSGCRRDEADHPIGQ